MKSTIVLIMVLALTSLSFGLDLSLEDMQGGSEERVVFRKIDEGELLSFKVAKSDPNDTSSVRMWNAPKGSRLENGVFSWMPSSTQSGMYDISFSITDPDTEKLVFAMTRIVVSDTIFSIRYSRTFELLFTATDPDDDRIEITATGLPTGATLTGNQFGPKIFKWRPTRQQLGKHQFTLTATDFPGDEGPSKTDVRIVYINVSRR